MRRLSDGYKRKKGSKVHIAVDTLGHLLALKVTPANEQERAQVADLVASASKRVKLRLEPTSRWPLPIRVTPVKSPRPKPQSKEFA